MSTLESYVQHWPHGHIRTFGEILEDGITTQDVQLAVRRRVLKSIGHGGYARNDDEISWQHGLYALQSKQKSNFIEFFAGGLTALLIHSCGSNCDFFDKQSFFYTTNEKFPPWFKRLSGENSSYTDYKNRIPLSIKDSFTKFMTTDGLQYIISSPERALFELCLTHKDISHIKNIILSIQGLNITVLNTILKFSFPSSSFYNFKLLAESLSESGKSELQQSLSNFISGDSPNISWEKLNGERIEANHA